MGERKEGRKGKEKIESGQQNTRLNKELKFYYGKEI